MVNNFIMKNNVAIIGAGPAGIACAIQLKRYNLDPVIFEKNQVGGLLKNANFVENYPGFHEGIAGNELVNILSSHLEKLKIFPVFEEVKEVNFCNNFYEIKTNKSCYNFKILVVATGTAPKKLNIQSGKVFYEIYELYKFDLTDKKIVIIGSGDAAFDYALNLAEKSKAGEIVILNRGTQTRCLPILKQRVLKNAKIQYIENKEFDENTEYDYILGAIGREAELGYLGKSAMPGAHCAPYLIGDVKNGHFRQTAIAAGDGIRAAMEIVELLSKKL